MLYNPKNISKEEEIIELGIRFLSGTNLFNVVKRILEKKGK